MIESHEQTTQKEINEEHDNKNVPCSCIKDAATAIANKIMEKDVYITKLKQGNEK